MSLSRDADLSSFSMLDLFRMEADGQARTLTDGLLTLEQGSDDPATIEEMMRAAHSIKGAAAIVGLDAVVQLAHGMEDAFVAAQNGQLQLTPARIDALLAGVDLIVQFSVLEESGLQAWQDLHAERIGATMSAIEGIAAIMSAPPLSMPPMAPASARNGAGTSTAADAAAAAAATAAAAAAAAAVGAIAAADDGDIDAALAAAIAADAAAMDDWQPAPLAPPPALSVADVATTANPTTASDASHLANAAPERRAGHERAGAAAKPSASAQNFDRLLALASESRINAHQMHPFIQSLQRFKRNQGSLFQALDQLHEALARHGDAALSEKSALALQKAQPLKQFMLEHLADTEAYERRLLGVSKHLVDEVLALRMRPFRDGVHAFPRMVRDLARSLGKNAQLIVSGEDTLVDRDILASIESPLNHMLRNAVDHGMESPEQRAAAGKPVQGTITLEARHRAGMLSIEIADDGGGVDLERIRNSVVERKMASAAMAAVMSQAELLEFLFLPAFSLRETANAISGRGVGLDIVHQAIREQNGTVRIESEAGVGFRTLITLPLTQSIVRVLVVDVQGEAYAVPIVKVERVLKLAQADIHTLESKQFFSFNGEHLGLVSAAQVLGLGELASAEGELSVVVIGAGQRRYALVVDAIRGEQSLAVQSLDAIFGKMRDISSAALLDDGLPVLILDVSDLLLSIDKLLHEGGLHQLARSEGAGARKVKRILVVDDSLTVREMERKLLTSRGYQVDIAIDGIDGWNVVRSGDYDLVVTDVDMPRMDGIELVGLIKKDIHLHKLPVMIVSYKDRPEDRARGMTAGADYYLTKGSFHDETLLDAVFDLIGEATR